MKSFHFFPAFRYFLPLFSIKLHQFAPWVYVDLFLQSSLFLVSFIIPRAGSAGTLVQAGALQSLAFHPILHTQAFPHLNQKILPFH